MPKLVEKMVASLKKKGVRLLTQTKAENLLIERGKVKGVAIRDLATGKAASLQSDYVVVATGRGGARWFGEVCRKMGIQTKFQPLDVGVRVEVPSEIMADVTSVNWDPKFHIRTKKYDDFVRTFCTNPEGFVITESYGDFICVNGHSMRDKKSKNTNFALLVQIALTEPVENTTAYGEGIAKLATIIGGGKPTLQRLGDLTSGKRSTWERVNRSYVSPTLREVTPGDISMALPSRVVEDIIEGLDMLNKVVPGVAEDGTLLYAPEIKFHALRVAVSNEMETPIPNLYASGDGAGVSRGIVGASVTGVMAARAILKKLGKEVG
ncbi:FAD binding domain protein [uncultured archaeon]|nr:FAD binding domain protein [uncultured archaeon]